MKQILYKYCITATEAIKEIGISRNAFYKKNGDDPFFNDFKNKHSDDWEFTTNKLARAIDLSGLTQLRIAEILDINHVRLNYYLHGGQRPSRLTGHYQKLKEFCKKHSGE